MTPDEPEKDRNAMDEETHPGTERTRGELINRQGPAHKGPEDEAEDPDVDLYTSAEADEPES